MVRNGETARRGLHRALAVLSIVLAAGLLTLALFGRQRPIPPSDGVPTPATPEQGPPLQDHPVARPTALPDESESEVVPRRLGLHVTEAELAVWRERTRKGPYKTHGDVSRNSPGDWDRITANAAAFMANPSERLWMGPVRNTPKGCVQKVNDAADNPRFVPPWNKADEVRDAAFVAMVNGSHEHARAVKDFLLKQTRARDVDFADRDRFCLGQIAGDENPVFNIANWLTRLHFAYDYVNIHDPEIFSPSETRRVEYWFASAAEWMQYAVDSKLDELFLGRANGDYRLTEVARDDWSRRLYEGGPVARTLQRRYNNRAAAAVRYVSLVGVAQANESFIATGKRYVEDFLRFGYYPEGVVGEFERWNRRNPTKGWKYAAEQLGSVITIADSLARIGDDDLYKFHTVDGALGTEGTHHSGAPKSLRTLTLDLLHYVDGTYQRTTPPGDEILPADDRWIHDIMLVMANRYFEDDHIRSIYTRENASPYPDNPRQSQGRPESGEWGIYPGVLFMFGQLENADTPYCSTSECTRPIELS